jgi:hypothetical protein
MAGRWQLGFYAEASAVRFDEVMPGRHPRNTTPEPQPKER